LYAPVRCQNFTLDKPLHQAQIRKLMPNWKKIATIAKLIVEICGGWWGVMSGAFSVPFAFMALYAQGRERMNFAVLAYCALWVFVVRVGWKNFKLRERLEMQTTPTVKPLKITIIPAHKLAEWYLLLRWKFTMTTKA
jgi:hypothetical protein